MSEIVTDTVNSSSLDFANPVSTLGFDPSDYFRESPPKHHGPTLALKNCSPTLGLFV